MSVSRDERHGTWTVQCWYRDWKGERHKKTRRGFVTKTEARKWEQAFLVRCKGTPSMTLSEFFKLYEEDVRPRLKQSTWDTKEHMVRTKILPYLGERPLNEITSADVIRWQNELMAMRGPTGEPCRPTYLHAVSNQLSALLNHAVLHYDLPSNPARKVPKMGSKDAGEMSMWTKEQCLRFSRAIMDKPDSWMAFELLYWTGIREGELLALMNRNVQVSPAIRCLHPASPPTSSMSLSNPFLVMYPFARPSRAASARRSPGVRPRSTRWRRSRSNAMDTSRLGCRSKNAERRTR